MTPHEKWRQQRRTERNVRILALRGTMTFVQIAEKMNVTLGVVCGVCRRATQERSPRSRKAKPQPAVRRCVSIPRDLYAEALAHASGTNSNFNQLCREGVRRVIEAAAAEHQS